MRQVYPALSPFAPVWRINSSLEVRLSAGRIVRCSSLPLYQVLILFFCSYGACMLYCSVAELTSPAWCALVPCVLCPLCPPCLHDLGRYLLKLMLAWVQVNAGSCVGLSLSQHLVCVSDPAKRLLFYCSAWNRYGRPILIVSFIFWMLHCFDKINNKLYLNWEPRLMPDEFNLLACPSKQQN